VNEHPSRPRRFSLLCVEISDSEVAFSRLARFLSGCGFADFAARPERLTLSTIATLRESLADTVDAGSDPNTAAFRHVLLLDPTTKWLLAW